MCFNKLVQSGQSALAVTLSFEKCHAEDVKGLRVSRFLRENNLQLRNRFIDPIVLEESPATVRPQIDVVRSNFERAGIECSGF